MRTCMERNWTRETLKNRFPLIPKSAGSHPLLMSLVIVGLGGPPWNRVLLKVALGGHRSRLMNGPCMHWEGQVVPCNAFQHKARSTSVRSAILPVLCLPGKRNTQYRRKEEEVEQ